MGSPAAIPSGFNQLDLFLSITPATSQHAGRQADLPALLPAHQMLLPQAPGESERGLGLTAKGTQRLASLIMGTIVLNEDMDFADPLKHRSGK